MIYNVYAVLDRKAGVYALPFFCPNDAVAMRHFDAAAYDPQQLMSKYPEDFSLVKLGQYDDEAGIIEGEVQPVHMKTAMRLSTN